MTFVFPLYPATVLLDFAGPVEVFSRFPGAKVLLAAETMEPICTECGAALLPHVTWDECPQADVLCVPGGRGVEAMMEHEPCLAFLRRQAEGAQWVTSVCSGSLLLGAAGLLDGYRATSQWASLEFLQDLGALPTSRRVVEDRNRLTAAGVSAGLDLALFLLARLSGPQLAQSVQLQLEYDPAPPFQVGSPLAAPASMLEQTRQALEGTLSRRREIVRRLAARRREQAPVE